MRVYLDILFFFNFIFDFIILLSSEFILKRNIKIYRIILGALFGSLTLICLIIPFNTLTLFLFKIIVSAVMVIITFNFNNIRYFFVNLYYFYLISIIMGGFIYFINNSFSYSNNFIFFNTFKLNLLLSFLITSIGIYIYVKNIKKLKLNYNKYLKATIFFNDYDIDVTAFVDSGNKLVDPYFFKPIILVEEKKVLTNDNYIYVPYNVANSDGLLKCIKPNKIYIEGIGYKSNFLVGLIDSINIDGINCLLNEKLLEG